jgi:8-oxo-dGTP diphosphatase
VVTVAPERSLGDDVESSTASAGGDRDMSIIVDIANVMGARADGWWKDPAGAALRLCREIAELAARGLANADLPAGVPEVTGKPGWVLVLEGRAKKAATGWADVSDPESLADPQPLTRLVLAPGSGDDAIAREAADLPGCRLVVTADRELRRRCEQAGAAAAGPRWLLNML